MYGNRALKADLPGPFTTGQVSFESYLHRKKVSSGTVPYGHLGNTVTWLLQPLFVGHPAKWLYIFLQKSLINMVTR